MNRAYFEQFIERQEYYYECGLCSLLTAIRLFGGDICKEQLREWTGTTETGTSLLGLKEAAERIGLLACPCEMSIDSLKDCHSPVILFVKGSSYQWHFITFLAYAGGVFWVADPAEGVKKITEADLSASWIEGKALYLEKQHEFEHPYTKKSFYRSAVQAVFHYSQKTIFLYLIKLLLQVAFCFLLWSCTNYLVQCYQVYDCDLSHLFLYLGCFIILFIVQLYWKQLLFRWYHAFVGMKEIRAAQQQTQQTYGNILLENRRNAKGLHRKFSLQRQFYYHFFQLIFEKSISLLLLLIPLWWLPEFFVAYLFVGVLLYLSHLHFYERETGAEQQMAFGLKRYYQLHRERIFFLKDIILTQEMRYHIHRLDQSEKELGQFANKWYRIFLERLTVWQALIFMLAIGQLTYVFYAAATARITFSVSFFLLILVGVGNYILYKTILTFYAVITSKKFVLNDTVYSKVWESRTGKALKEIPQIIEGKNIFFRYPGRKALFNDISFTIRMGECIVLSGTNKSGKSSFLALLLQQCHPVKGEIVINTSQVLSNISLASWQKELAYVPQEIKLLQGNLWTNICFGDTVGSEEEMRQMIVTYELEFFLELLPFSYQTQLGEGAYQLNTSQKQFLGLMRALYRKPSLLLLDNFANEMDAHQIVQLKRVLNKAREHMAIIIVSERFPSLQSVCDKKWVLHMGALEEKQLKK